MTNFTHYLPTKIYFGKGQIRHLSELTESGKSVLLTELYVQSHIHALNNEIFIMDPSADKNNQLKYIAVFWQLSIWYIAANANPVETMVLLEMYWNIPAMKTKSGSGP